MDKVLQNNIRQINVRQYGVLPWGQALSRQSNQSAGLEREMLKWDLFISDGIGSSCKLLIIAQLSLILMQNLEYIPLSME